MNTSSQDVATFVLTRRRNTNVKHKQNGRIAVTVRFTPSRVLSNFRNFLCEYGDFVFVYEFMKYRFWSKSKILRKIPQGINF